MKIAIDILPRIMGMKFTESINVPDTTDLESARLKKDIECIVRKTLLECHISVEAVDLRLMKINKVTTENVRYGDGETTELTSQITAVYEAYFTGVYEADFQSTKDSATKNDSNREQERTTNQKQRKRYLRLCPCPRLWSSSTVSNKK